MGIFGDIANGASGILGTTIANANAGDLVGDALTGGAISNARAVADTNARQEALAQKQMDFQERMSNSAYQRAIADMKAAGLNPALAYQNGGASAPTGAMATLTAPRPGDIGAGLANSAKQAASMAPQIKNTESQTTLNHANANVADVSAQKITATAKETETNTRLLEQQVEKAKYDKRQAKAAAEARELDTDIKKARGKVDKFMAVPDAVRERIEQLLGTANSGMKVFKRATIPLPDIETGSTPTLQQRVNKQTELP